MRFEDFKSLCQALVSLPPAQTFVGEAKCVLYQDELLLISSLLPPSESNSVTIYRGYMVGLDLFSCKANPLKLPFHKLNTINLYNENFLIHSDKNPSCLYNQKKRVIERHHLIWKTRIKRRISAL